MEKAEKKALMLTKLIRPIPNIIVSEPEISGTTVGLNITFNNHINALDIAKELESSNPSIWARANDSKSLIFRMGEVNENDINTIAERLSNIIELSK
jgi:hypothetical protein